MCSGRLLPIFDSSKHKNKRLTHTIMKTRNYLGTPLLKIVIIVVAILVIILQSATAQGLKQFVRDYQFGFEASFGIKTFNMTSNIAQINGLSIIEEGGNIGVGIGSGALRIKLKQGYYYSSSAVAHTVDEVRSSAVANIYLMQLFSKNNSRLQPYITGTMERNIFKMYGTYGENKQPRNYSVSEAPYLGSISSVVASFGAGLEYKITTPGHFVSLFAEGRCGKTINVTSTSEMFSNTAISNQVVANIGVVFGYSR
jgi:hypothetical protein